MDTALPCISPAELAALLGRPDAPLLLDVRRRESFVASGHMLPAARWCAPEAVVALASAQAPTRVVVYCAHGHDLSQGATRALRNAGWDACFLRGGILGGEAHRWSAHAAPKVGA